MRILAVESSCDETAVAVVDDGRQVRASIVASQARLHEEYGGVVPEIASRAHVQRIIPTYRKALAEADINPESIDAVAVGNRPGLIGSLLVGVSFAKALAWSLAIPVIAVDHVHAHLYAGCLENHIPEMDALGLVVSGGHTATFHLQHITEPIRLGSTIDDAVGEAYDKAAMILGLGYPGGARLDALATRGDPSTHSFPISRLAPDSLDFSFSGLKTSLLYRVRGRPAPGGVFERDFRDLPEHERANLAASFQQAAVAAIILKLQRALAHMRSRGRTVRSLLVGGGVSANSLLRSRLHDLADAEGLDLRLPPQQYCVDNAAMIAGLAFHLYRAGQRDGMDLTATPTTAC